MNVVFSIVVVFSQTPVSHAGETDSAWISLSFGRVAVEWADSVPVPLTAAVERCAHLVFSGAVSQTRFIEATRSLLELLARDGYHHAAVAPRDFRTDGGTLGLRLVIDPGPQLLIGGWRFTGLARTDTVWLASVLDLPVGVPWTPVLADRIRRQLQTFSHIAAAGTPQLESESTDSSAIVVIPLLERSPATVDGMLAASGVEGESASRQLTGRLTLGLSGLFHRDRTLVLRYERPQRTETLFRLDLREAGAFGRRLDWQLGIEEWDRLDHRQTVGLAVGYRLAAHDLRFAWGGRLVRVTPGRSVTAPARTAEVSLGLGSGPPLDVAQRRVQSLTAWDLQVTSSHRRQLVADASTMEGVSRRGRLDLRAVRTWVSAGGWYSRLAGRAHWWFTRGTLAAGDEWFLGGEDVLRGYEDRTLIAASGAVGAIELGRIWDRGFGIGVFGESGALEPFGTAATWPGSPVSYGAAILLFARDRTARLEAAWRDRTTWGDGILRLSVTQEW